MTFYNFPISMMSLFPSWGHVWFEREISLAFKPSAAALHKVLREKAESGVLNPPGVPNQDVTGMGKSALDRWTCQRP